LKRATDKAKKKYLESICDKVTEFPRRGHYDLMYVKLKELGWKENRETQNIGIENSKGSVVVDKRQVLKFSEN
jgi:hypothetical protein